MGQPNRLPYLFTSVHPYIPCGLIFWHSEPELPLELAVAGEIRKEIYGVLRASDHPMHDNCDCQA